MILQCPNCAGLAKCDPDSAVLPTCPRCGWALDISRDLPPPVPVPNPNEFEAEEEVEAEIITAGTEPSAASPLLPKSGTAARELISNLSSGRPADPLLDADRLKHTTDKELVSKAEERIRVKRQSRRVAKELTGWDEEEAQVEIERAESRPRRRRRTPLWNQFARLTVNVFVPAGLVCLVVYGVIASLREKEVVVPEPEISAAEAARNSLPALEAAALERDQSKEIYMRVRAVAEQFLNAGTWQERLAVVRQPGRVGPLMERYYSDPDNPDGPVPHRPIAENGRVQVYKSLLLIAIENEDRSRRPLAVERSAQDGEYRVDWESFVGHCEVSWKEIPEKRPSQPFVLRARVKRGNFFNFGFRDDKWTCWHLDDATGEHRLYGYTKRNGATEIGLVEAQRGTKEEAVYVLLKVRSAHQVEITEVIAKGWVAQ